jgi:hypothetical protein
MNDDGPTVSPRWERASLFVVAGLCAVKIVTHFLLVGRYGYHGDELYFLECGRHLAAGYVDHPPLIPWIARVSDELGGGLFVVRLPAMVAGAGTMVFTALIVREWRGGWRAQLVAMLCLLVGPAHLRIGAMLNIPVIEVFLATVTAYLVIRALSRAERWTWLFAGLVLGLAILAKHSSVIWAAALAIGLVATPHRRVFATRWPWLGLTVACLLAMPNLVWQTQHDFATLEFIRALRHDVLDDQGRGLFAAGQLLYFHPLAAPAWIVGIGFAFARGGVMRAFAILFVVMASILLVSGGKPYYLASAYPAVLAAGGIALERWAVTHAAAWRAYVVAFVVTGVALALLTLPVFPIAKVDAAMDSVLGWAVPPIALTHDLHGMHGWEEHAAAVDQVYRSLPLAERSRATVLVGSYSQAAAINMFRDEQTPRAVSGHMTYFLWGPDDERGAILITYGLPLQLVRRHYRSCVEGGRIHAALARPFDSNLPIYVCRDQSEPLRSWWTELKWFRHG